MPHQIHKEADELTEADWNRLFAASTEKDYQKAVKVLQERGNAATPASELFEGKAVFDTGQVRINNFFKNEGIPFRLVRIGEWIPGENRNHRPLALKRWSYEKKRRRSSVKVP